jgi:hypothetical protein
MPPEIAEIKNKRRSKRVILRVAVVVSIDFYDGKVISEATVIQVVNAHESFAPNGRIRNIRATHTVRPEDGELGAAVTLGALCDLSVPVRMKSSREALRRNQCKLALHFIQRDHRFLASVPDHLGVDRRITGMPAVAWKQPGAGLAL